MNEEINNTTVVNEVQNNPAPGTRYNGSILVRGTDVMQYSVNDLPDELIDEMTDEQANLYKQGLSEEEVKLFNERFGYFESVKLSEEELNKRSERRSKIFNSLKGKKIDEKSEEAAAPVQIKTEQTGSVIFGRQE